MIDLIIFDCDGVVADTEPITTAVLREMMEELGAPLSAVDTEGFSGPAMSIILERMAQLLGRPLPASFINEYRVRSYERLRTNVRPEPGLMAALDALSHRMCIASNGPREKVEIVVRACGLAPLMGAAVYSAYELEIWKPDPEFFHAVARSASVAPERCAVVEDSPVGATAGVRAGMRTILYDPRSRIWPKLYDEPEFAGRLSVLQHFDDLPELLAGGAMVGRAV